MIISWREGCSGSFLTQLLLCDKPTKPFFQMLPFDLRDKTHAIGPDAMQEEYAGQSIIVGHLTDYELLRKDWPDHPIYRISPVTQIFKAISLQFHKKWNHQPLWPHQTPDAGPISTKGVDVDIILGNIKEYYELHTTDPVPNVPNGYTVDFGQLDNREYIEKMFNIKLNQYQQELLQGYWKLQEPIVPLDETIIKENISKEELLSGFSGQPTKFNLATYIFIYEKMNNILESQRTWTIDDVTDSTTWKQLLHLMVYQ